MKQIPNTTHNTAISHLKSLESEYDINMLLAVAHGSHAWGLANDSSDYDIKAIFAATDIEQYAHLGAHRETINREFGDIEIEAWDVKKFAELLYKSNEQAIDVLRSPHVYYEAFDREPLREFILDSYNPIQLYHCYRSISSNNYRKYLSNHLVDNHDNTYPIIESTSDGYRVFNRETESEMQVPATYVDAGETFIDRDYSSIATDDEGRYCDRCGDQPETLPITYRTTQTKQTPKKNLAVLMNSMYARYLSKTGEGGSHQIPHVNFQTFLSEQAPDVLPEQEIDMARELVERKLAGEESEIGDLIGEDLANPEKDIDPSVHASGNPDRDKLNEFVAQMIQA